MEQTSRSEQAVLLKTAVLKLRYKVVEINTEFRVKKKRFEMEEDFLVVFNFRTQTFYTAS